MKTLLFKEVPEFSILRVQQKNHQKKSSPKFNFTVLIIFLILGFFSDYGLYNNENILSEDVSKQINRINEKQGFRI